MEGTKAHAIHGTGAASDYIKDGEPEDFEARVRRLKRESEQKERERYAQQQEQDGE